MRHCLLSNYSCSKHALTPRLFQSFVTHACPAAEEAAKTEHPSLPKIASRFLRARHACGDADMGSNSRLQIDLTTTGTMAWPGRRVPHHAARVASRSSDGLTAAADTGHRAAARRRPPTHELGVHCPRRTASTSAPTCAPPPVPLPHPSVPLSSLSAPRRRRRRRRPPCPSAGHADITVNHHRC